MEWFAGRPDSHPLRYLACLHVPRSTQGEGRKRGRNRPLSLASEEEFGTRSGNVRANLRRLVKRILRKHGHPPDKQEKATRTVLEQAEVLSSTWAA